MAFIIECAVCAAAFIGLAQIKPCKLLGFLLLFPSIGLIASAVGFLVRPEIDVSIYTAYGLIGTSAALTILLVWVVIKKRGETIAERFSRLIYAASLSAPLSLIIGIILSITNIEDDVATLVCLSTAAFGGAALLIAVNLIIVSLCGYKSTADSLKTIRRLYISKKLVFVRFSLAKDAFLVVSKTALSIIALSLFMFANALYSAGLGVARYIAVRMHKQSREEQIKSFFYVGTVIFIASVCYVLYSIRLFYGDKSATYHMVVGIAIACYTFLEFGINVREAFRLRKSKELEAKALRAISLSSTLLCFVLTQTAIMSFAHTGDASFFNALSGVVFGGLAALVGIYVMIESTRIKTA